MQRAIPWDYKKLPTHFLTDNTILALDRAAARDCLRIEEALKQAPVIINLASNIILEARINLIAKGAIQSQEDLAN